MKRVVYSKTPAHIRGAIREAAREGGWETTDGVRLTDLLDETESENKEEST